MCSAVIESRIQTLSINASFPREARLLGAADYAQTFKRNKRLSNRFWIVLGHRKGLIKNSSESLGESKPEPSRLGLAIAKKRAKRAVDRNRIKRIARESFRHNRTLLVGYDAVVMNKDHAASASTLELRQSLDALWLELINKK